MGKVVYTTDVAHCKGRAFEIIKLERPRVNKCEACDRFEECYHYPDMKNLCDKENMGDVYYVKNSNRKQELEKQEK